MSRYAETLYFVVKFVLCLGAAPFDPSGTCFIVAVLSLCAVPLFFWVNSVTARIGDSVTR